MLNMKFRVALVCIIFLTSLIWVPNGNSQEMTKLTFAIASKILHPVIANAWIGDYVNGKSERVSKG